MLKKIVELCVKLPKVLLAAWNSLP